MVVVRMCDSGMEGLHAVLLICQPTDTIEWASWLIGPYWAKVLAPLHGFLILAESE